MDILKYLVLALICIPIMVLIWVIGIVIIAAVSLPLVIRGALEAVYSKVYG